MNWIWVCLLLVCGACATRKPPAVRMALTGDVVREGWYDIQISKELTLRSIISSAGGVLESERSPGQERFILCRDARDVRVGVVRVHARDLDVPLHNHPVMAKRDR